MSEKNNDPGKTLADQITDTLNTFGHDSVIKSTVEYLSRSHRTLQQTFTMLCCAWFRQLAKDPDHCDLRNEASVKLACKIVKLCDNEMYLPFI